MGVKRAVDKTLKESVFTKHIATFGPLIHNPQTLSLFQEKGVTIIDSPESAQAGTVIIRAHGVAPNVLRALRARPGVRICNATCPKVANVQGAIKKYSQMGYHTLIVGDSKHAEVMGLKGYAQSGCTVIANEQEAKTVRHHPKLLVISQTTFNWQRFETIAEIITAQNEDVVVKNTICDSTWQRQNEVKKLATIVDALIIIGGKNSANTQRLGSIASRLCRHVYTVENTNELPVAELRQFATIGVASGASTPTWLINEVVLFLKTMAKSGQKRMFHFMIFLLRTQLVPAAAGFILTLGFMHYLRFETNLLYPIISALYLLAMNQINNLLDLKFLRLLEPEKYYYFNTFRPFFITVSAISLAAVLLSAYGLARPFTAALFLSLAIIAGLVYKIRFPLPGHKQPSFSLSDIPGSKDIVFSLAMAGVTILVPVLGQENLVHDWYNISFVCIFVITITLTNSFFRDIKNILDDKVIGNETIPVVIGKGRTYLLMSVLFAVLAFIVAVTAAAGFVHLRNLFFLLVTLYLAATVTIFSRIETDLNGETIALLSQMNYFIIGTAAYIWF